METGNDASTVESLDEDAVADCFACPRCGENRMDLLIWNRAGTEVTCKTCGVTYDPNR